MARTFYDPGRYWGEITHQRIGETSNGNPQLVITFVVKGRVNPAEPDGDLLPVNQEYERSVFRAITDKTIDWVLQDLDTLGWYGQSWQQFDEQAAGFVSIIGTGHAFRCDHEAHYQTGQAREVWSVGGEVSGLAVKPLDEGKAKALDAMFGRHLKTRKKPGGNGEEKPKPKPADYSKPVADLTPDERQRVASTPDSEIPF